MALQDQAQHGYQVGLHWATDIFSECPEVGQGFVEVVQQGECPCYQEGPTQGQGVQDAMALDLLMSS